VGIVIAADFPLGGIIWSIFILYFWFMLIWMFIATFADIFRRRDLSGVAKALWVVLIFILPFLGILIYVIARPRGGDHDAAMTAEPAAPPRMA
jgi:uncharacterized membrane protein